MVMNEEGARKLNTLVDLTKRLVAFIDSLLEYFCVCKRV